MTIIELIITFFLFIIIGILAYLFHKIKCVHLMQFELLRQCQKFPDTLNLTYHQIQAFTVLDRHLQLKYALPPLRGWAASPDFLLLIAEHALRRQPETIVECSSGASTIVLAQSAKRNGKGHVYSLEHDVHYAQKTRQELVKHGLQSWATVIHAPLKEYTFAGQSYTWYQESPEISRKTIDMLIIDGPPASLNVCARYPAGPVLLPLLSEEAFVFLDDADRPDEQLIIKSWLVEFPGLTEEKYYCEKGAVSLRKSS